MSKKENFSLREKNVIELLIKGKSNKQIALELGVSARAVEFHLSNIYKKLKVSSRTEAVLKLSEYNLRESVDITENPKFRGTVVENKDKIIENNDNLFQLWRYKMKNISLILISVAIIGLIILSFMLYNINFSINKALPQPTSTLEFITITETATSTNTIAKSSNVTSLSYEILSPTEIKKDNMTFKVLAELLTCSQVKVEVVGTFPADFPDAYPESNYPSLIEEIQVSTTSADITLALDPTFGGGGGADINNTHIRGQGLAYSINPALTIGQTIHITIFIKFGNFIGISEIVQFEIDVVAEQCE